MKVIIQIPCLNEEAQLPETLASLPTSLKGVDEVEWLIIDDGSDDKTAEVALANGAHHVVRLKQNRGLAAAFQVGLDASLKLGADIIVNTDADNQYDSNCIVDLVRPIIANEADVVVGVRDIAGHDEFSPLKKKLQRAGSWVVRKASGTNIADTTSGFRAYSSKAALELAVVNDYSYTLESLIQSGRRRTAIQSVPIATNPKVRESRLFTSMGSYIRRSGLTILRVFAHYEPISFFGTIAVTLIAFSAVAFSPFVFDWLFNGDSSGHLQSILVGVALFVAGVQVGALAIVADLSAANRRVSSEALQRLRRLELHHGVNSQEIIEHSADTNRSTATNNSAVIDRSADQQVE